MPMLVEYPPSPTEHELRLGLENLGVQFTLRAWGDKLPSFPLQLFTAELREVALGKLSTAPFGWRYPIDVEGKLAFADMTYSSEPQFKALSRGGIGASLPNALRAAYSFSDAAEQKLRVRILDIPGVYSYSIWLHGGKNVDWFFGVTRGDATPEAVSRDDFLADISHRASLVAGLQAPEGDVPDPFKP